MFPPPSIAPPDLEDWQFFYRGLTFGAGTPFGVLKVEGLDLATIRSGDVSWPRDHGQSSGLDLYEGRDVIFDLWMKTDGESLQAAQLELAAATTVLPSEEVPLWFQLPNLPVLCILCRPRKKPIPIDSDYAAAQVAKPELSLHAADPRIYTAGIEDILTLKEPPTAPRILELTNTGNTEMRPIIVFTGPLSRPWIASQTLTGEPKLELSNAWEANEEEYERHAKEVAEELAAWKKEYEETFGKPPTEEMIAKKKEELWEPKEEEAETETAKRTKEEEEGTRSTVKAGDQLLLSLGNPHLVLYYPGGLVANAPEDVANWITPDSTWWDIIPGLNKLAFSSFNEKDSGGTAAVQWASATQL